MFFFKEYSQYETKAIYTKNNPKYTIISYSRSQKVIQYKSNHISYSYAKEQSTIHNGSYLNYFYYNKPYARISRQK